MLPDFSRLRLKACTGDFIELGDAESAAEFNFKHQGGDPIELEEWKVYDEAISGDRIGDGWVFRVRHALQVPGSPYGYDYYNPTSLWEWIRSSSRQPLTNTPIWYEDWVDLHDHFSPTSPFPDWVDDLPRRNDSDSDIGYNSVSDSESNSGSDMCDLPSRDSSDSEGSGSEY